jgi:hypothetical protein
VPQLEFPLAAFVAVLVVCKRPEPYLILPVSFGRSFQTMNIREGEAAILGAR